MSTISQRTMRFLGRSYMAFVFTPELPIIEWLAQLDGWLARSPGFFVDRPVVLDLANVKLFKAGIAHLVDCLLERNIRVIGLEGADPSQLGPELPPVLSGGRPAGHQRDRRAPRRSSRSAAPPPKQPASLLIERPVRSGQSIVFPEGDVSVLGSVGSGAEVVAGGSVHIYGTLRGRAMAGPRAIPAPAFSARRSKPSCWRSMATTGRPRKSSWRCAAGRSRLGSRRRDDDHGPELIREGGR